MGFFIQAASRRADSGPSLRVRTSRAAVPEADIQATAKLHFSLQRRATAWSPKRAIDFRHFKGGWIRYPIFAAVEKIQNRPLDKSERLQRGHAVREFYAVPPKAETGRGKLRRPERVLANGPENCLNSNRSGCPAKSAHQISLEFCNRIE